MHWTHELQDLIFALQVIQGQSVEYQDYGGAACAIGELCPAQEKVEYARGMLGRVEFEIRKRSREEGKGLRGRRGSSGSESEGSVGESIGGIER